MKYKTAEELRATYANFIFKNFTCDEFNGTQCQTLDQCSSDGEFLYYILKFQQTKRHVNYIHLR